MCKGNGQQGINLQNIQIAHEAKLKKKKKKEQQPNQKLGKKLRHFSKEVIEMAKRSIKRYSTWLIIREMQITTTMRYQLTQVRIAIIKKSTKNKELEVMWRQGNPLTLLVGI